MNEASAWRLRLAKRVGQFYARHPGVAAIGIGGSVARGHADRYSDIEIFIYWADPPTDEARAVLAEQAGATNRRDYGWDDEYHEWGEDGLVRGVKIDLTHFTVATVESFLDDVLICFDATDHKSDQLAQLISLIPIAGHEIIRRWQDRAAQYPDGLARAIVHQQLEFGPRSWVELLAARGDVLALANIEVMALRHILAVLEALNGMYHRPGDKWIDRSIDEMRIKPPDLSKRMQALFRAEPAEAISLLHEIMEDTIGLVEEHMPEFDTTPVRARIQYRRPVWNEPPEDLR